MKRLEIKTTSCHEQAEDSIISKLYLKKQDFTVGLDIPIFSQAVIVWKVKP